MSFPANPAQVFIAPGTTDMRKSINGLSILVVDQFELDSFTGSLFVFCNRKRDIVKILYWDHSGFCLWHKRLEKDRSLWPEAEEGVLNVRGRELTWLLDGLSIDQREAHQRLSYTNVM